MTETLQPCPNCGSTDLHACELIGRPQFVVCLHCEYRGPVGHSIDDAKAKWNAAGHPLSIETRAEINGWIEREAARRDMFAAAALTGLMAGDHDGQIGPEKAAEISIRFADSMLAALVTLDPEDETDAAD